jgi:dihydroorotase
VAGARRWAWDAVDADRHARDPWADGALVAGPYAAATRARPPLRSPEDALACVSALGDGTADALATDHAPRTEVDTHVEYGEVAPGIAGLETAVGIALAAVAGGRLTLARAIEALTTGPARVIGERHLGAPSIREGAPADLVVIDRSTSWMVSGESLRTRGRNTPLLGRELAGVVRITLAGGRIAYRA